MTTIRIPGVTKTVAATFGIALVLAVAGATGRSAVADEPTFERDIRPILRAHCLDCHGGVEELQGGLDLRQVRLMQKGGESHGDCSRRFSFQSDHGTNSFQRNAARRN